MGVSIVMGVPHNRWFITDNPNPKWRMTGDTPILGHMQIPRVSEATLHDITIFSLGGYIYIYIYMYIYVVFIGVGHGRRPTHGHPKIDVVTTFTIEL